MREQILLAVYVPVLAVVLKLVDPGSRGWVLAIGMSLIPWMIGQILKSKALRWGSLQSEEFKPSRI